MTTRQTNKLTMYQQVHHLLSSNAGIVMLRPALQTHQSILLNHINDIRQSVQVQLMPITGITLDKRTAKTTLADKASVLAGVISAMAVANNNNKLAAETNYSFTKLFRMSEVILPEVVYNIITLASANIAGLAGYGILSADITALQQQRQQYINLVPAHPLNRAQKKTQTALIVKQLAVTDKLLKRSIDKLVSTLRSSHPDFVLQYFNARTIIDLGQRHSAVSGQVKDISSGLGIPSALITIEELHRNTSTNPDGTFRIQKFRKALYHLTISAQGYRTKTIPVVTLLGKTISLNISLQKDLSGTEKTFLRKVA